MTQAEKYALASLAALAGVYAWFAARMLDGLVVVDQSPARLLWTYFATIGLATLAETVIGMAVLRGKRVMDERDLAIEARAGRAERFFMIAAINVLLWQVLWENLIPNHALPRLDVTRAAALIFWLFTLLFVGEALKRVTTLVLYRVEAASV